MPKQMLRAYYDKFTRPARSSHELQFKKDLTELDPGLHLRWNFLKESWCVYYDHHGVLSSIRAIPPGGSFREAYQSIARNGKTTKRDLIFEHKASLGKNERESQRAYLEAQHQARHELSNMDKGRVISMQTDGAGSNIAG